MSNITPALVKIVQSCKLLMNNTFTPNSKWEDYYSKVGTRTRHSGVWVDLFFKSIAISDIILTIWGSIYIMPYINIVHVHVLVSVEIAKTIPCCYLARLASLLQKSGSTHATHTVSMNTGLWLVHRRGMEEEDGKRTREIVEDVYGMEESELQFWEPLYE